MLFWILGITLWVVLAKVIYEILQITNNHPQDDNDRYTCAMFCLFTLPVVIIIMIIVLIINLFISHKNTFKWIKLSYNNYRNKNISDKLEKLKKEIEELSKDIK
jgi:uncharacterized protein YacL